MALRILVAVLVLVAVGCGESRSGPKYGASRVVTTQGGAIVLSRDERVAVMTHRTSGLVTILHLDPAREPEDIVMGATSIDFGEGSQPWAAVMSRDDDTAFVILRGQGQLVPLRHLHAGPEAGAPVDVGSEPTSIVISPSGARVYVANWGEGTISVVLTSTLREAKWDLNPLLAATGRLGPIIESPDDNTGLWAPAELDEHQRPGLAHPRALAMSDDGDELDDDETLYATEFFSQPKPGGENTDPDTMRQGLVYALSATSGRPVSALEFGTLPLDAVEDTGFRDAEGELTGCFPNQLYAAAVSGNRLFVTGMCASPRGPVGLGPPGDLESNNFKTLVHPTVFVVDTQSHRELPPLVLTHELDKLYGEDAALAQAQNAPMPERRMPLIPNDVAIEPAPDAESSGTTTLYVTAMGANALFAIRLRADGSVDDIGFPEARYTDAGEALPIGIALSRSNPWALTLQDSTDSVSVLNRAVGSLTLKKSIAIPDRLPTRTKEILLERVPEDVRTGRRRFATGLESWSYQGQAWSSCESCHPDGLSDGVTWQFARGPRRTISTAATYFGEDETRRILLWTANADEVHDVEAVARGVDGGIGGVVWTPYGNSVDCRLLYDGKRAASAGGDAKCGGGSSDGDLPSSEPCAGGPKITGTRLNGLNGALADITYQEKGQLCDECSDVCDVNRSSNWDRIDRYIRTVRAPRAPTTLDAGRIANGERIFRTAQCGACHQGPGWTLSNVFYGRASAENNGHVPFDRPDAPADPATLDSILGLLRTTAYVIPEAAPSEFRVLNAPALQGMGAASFRSAPPEGTDVEDVLTFAYGPDADHPAPFPGLTDRINCVLRSVGTFPIQPQAEDGGPNLTGLVAPGTPPVREARRTLKPASEDTPARYGGEELAEGDAGFNIPSLLGLAASSSFFHAGNARSLEELLDETFVAHHAAMVPGLSLSREDKKNLVSYLLSIDESTPVTQASTVVEQLGFDPDLCQQFEQFQ